MVVVVVGGHRDRDRDRLRQRQKEKRETERETHTETVTRGTQVNFVRSRYGIIMADGGSIPLTMAGDRFSTHK